MSDLEDFLEQARSAGTLHSEGCFTLDPERANRILREYQLVDRAYYLAKLVQAAVAGRASEIHFTITSDRVEATLFGRDLLFFDTRDVLAALTQTDLPQEDGAMAHLTVGLNAALTLSARSIEWTVWNAWRQETLELTKSGSQLTCLRKRPWESHLPGYRFRLLRLAPLVEPAPPSAGVLASLKRMMSGPGPSLVPLDEGSQLRKRCFYAPIQVRLNGEILNDPDLGGDRRQVSKERQHWFEAFVLDGGDNCLAIPRARRRYAANLGMSPPACDFLYCVEARPGALLEFTEPGDWNGGALMLAVPTHRPRLSRITFVHYGIILESVEIDLKAPGARVVTTTVGLAVDLSQRAVVKNDLYEQRLDEIRDFILNLANDRKVAALPGLAKHIQPLYATIDATYVPLNEELDVYCYPNGQLKTVSHRSVRDLRLTLDAKSGQARLTSPTPGWPPEPPARDPRAWLPWVKGAIRCLASRGFVKYSAADLPGYCHDEEDGVRASFYHDGQLRSLAFYRSGGPRGWQLTLAHGVHSGEVKHVRDGWEEYYRGGAVVENQELPRAHVWSVWVNGWIEAVYRDAQL